ncbi:MAG TPA: inositol monophosphatase family protein [Anaerolineae bacterium]|nr:inositol monophosphatase family protein [Anaerolineae bacterium]HOQ97807.1 inositol monophosphatase family protein [Anaerolineae bacterium]HPL27120.1 inositol monophosphatase family protein [Anaerolineae bacterium]
MIETAVAAARAAGRILRDRFDQPHDVSSKGLRDVVTEADVLAQEAIVAQIRARFPGHQILTEEAGHALGPAADYCWIVDPLDGTTNYARGIPHFSVSIAAEHEGVLQTAVVYDPLGERLFHAARGEGAFLNGRRLHVSERSRLIDTLLDLGWARSPAARDLSSRVARTLGPAIGSVRTMGSAALGLAAVAAGWEDVYFHSELAPWDMAAGALLVREAGGVVTRPDGTPWDVFGGMCLATNGYVHQALVELIAPEM